MSYPCSLRKGTGLNWTQFKSLEYKDIFTHYPLLLPSSLILNISILNAGIKRAFQSLEFSVTRHSLLAQVPKKPTGKSYLFRLSNHHFLTLLKVLRKSILWNFREKTTICDDVQLH